MIPCFAIIILWNSETVKPRSKKLCKVRKIANETKNVKINDIG